MKRLISFAFAMFTVLCVLVATERQAFAYVDPGSGFVVLQTFASVAAACGYFMRRRIRGLFGTKDEVQSPALPAESGKGASSAGK